ncbi:MAG TPA: diacylglycerol kinase family protein, partial [Candidatus Angelobacter sp.]|nr:diacylglycerol kinase family protein [Candidatus Angelobacter sp.]
MNAAALLGLSAKQKTIEEFRIREGIPLSVVAELAENHSAALIFGGDGTVHRYLPQLYQQQIPTLVIPVGSGNDFAKALGISNVKDALLAWKQFCTTGKNVQEIDLGVIKPMGQARSEEIFFGGVAAIGMDADANARANRMPAWLKGRGGYLLAGLQSLLSFKPVELSVTVGERGIQRSAFFLAVGNAHRYGGGMRITLRAAMNDGLLDMCLVGKMNKLKLLCWIPTVFFGAHLRLSDVEYEQVQNVRIESERELNVYADGDFACKTPVEIRVLSRALPVIVPVP